MTAHTELFEFVLEQAEGQPAPKKARLYRALAEYAGDMDLKRELLEHADIIEDADHRCREFVFRFRSKGERK
jgi:hypothetical protein